MKNFPANLPNNTALTNHELIASIKSRKQEFPDFSQSFTKEVQSALGDIGEPDKKHTSLLFPAKILLKEFDLPIAAISTPVATVAAHDDVSFNPSPVATVAALDDVSFNPSPVATVAAHDDVSFNPSPVVTIAAHDDVSIDPSAPTQENSNNGSTSQFAVAILTNAQLEQRFELPVQDSVVVENKSDYSENAFAPVGTNLITNASKAPENDDGQVTGINTRVTNNVDKHFPKVFREVKLPLSQYDDDIAKALGDNKSAASNNPPSRNIAALQKPSPAEIDVASNPKQVAVKEKDIGSVRRPLDNAYLQRPPNSVKVERPTNTPKLQRPSDTDNLQRLIQSDKVERPSDILKVERPIGSDKAERPIGSDKTERPMDTGSAAIKVQSDRSKVSGVPQNATVVRPQITPTVDPDVKMKQLSARIGETLENVNVRSVQNHVFPASPLVMTVGGLHRIIGQYLTGNNMNVPAGQLVQKNLSAPSSGTKILTVNLLPANLGPVDITIKNSLGRLTIIIETQTTQAEQLIRSEVESITNSVKQAGQLVDEIQFRRAPMHSMTEPGFGETGSGRSGDGHGAKIGRASCRERV